VIKRAVFDTSVLVSAILRPDSVPHQALRKVLYTMELCATADTMTEMWNVLNRSKFDRYLDRETRRIAAEQIQRDCRMFSILPFDHGDLAPSCRDPNDNKFLALARAANAAFIVSSDADLLILNPWNGIPILTPAQFLTV
jgi:hypothetical protein